MNLQQLADYLLPNTENSESEHGSWLAGFVAAPRREYLDLRIAHWSILAMGDPRRDGAGFLNFNVRCDRPHCWQLTEEEVTQLEVADTHYLLSRREPYSNLYTNGVPDDVAKTRRLVQELMNTVGDRITLNGTLPSLLRREYGMFASGAATEIPKLADILAATGVRVSALPGENPRPGPPNTPGVTRTRIETDHERQRILLLGAAGYVIAQDFSVLVENTQMSPR